VTEEIKTWVKGHSGLTAFLVGEALTIAAILASIIAYAVRMDTRIETLEVRGSPHIERLEHRMTTTEAETASNKNSINRIVDVMTRELNKGDRK
jgi:hypothetical protein